MAENPENDNISSKTRTAKYIPHEPRKAATGPNCSPKTMRRYTARTTSTSSKILATNNVRPQNLIAYPGPTIVHKKDGDISFEKAKENKKRKPRKRLDDSLSDMYTTPETTPEVQRRLVLQDLETPSSDIESSPHQKSEQKDLLKPKQLLFTENFKQPITSSPANKPVNIVDPIPSWSGVPGFVNPPNLENVMVPTTSNSNLVSTNENISIDICELEMREIDRLRRLNKKYCDQIRHLGQEKDEFKKELEVQFKVNTELKKLLVASVGDDVQHRVERIIRDKARMTQEIDGYQKKVTDDHENIDKISIQADMWRSKFIASKVMIDELANWKAELSVRFRESQTALNQLLGERQQLKRSLLETYRYLQIVKDAFSPHPITSHHAPSGTIISLARYLGQLAESVKFKLLGAINIQGTDNLDEALLERHEELTPAESLAVQVIQSSMNIDVNERPCSSGSLKAPSPIRIDRFHPNAKFDQLTLNCCIHCKGDIKLV